MRDSRYSREAALAERRRARGRRRATIIAFALAGALAVGGTAAFLFTGTDPVENTFAPSSVATSVEETLSGAAKEDVSIRNTGDTTAYIRAAVVVTWQDKDGSVYGQTPVSNLENPTSYDYTITYDLSDGWVEGDDGFYYWTRPVKSQAEDPDNCLTGILVKSCTPVAGKAPKDYSLNVEILGSGIQAEGEATTTAVSTIDGTVYDKGTEPVVIAWSSGVSDVNADGTLRVKTA